MAVFVTIDYFSGIANPSWLLDPAQVQRLRQMFAALPAAPLDALQAIYPRLGYQGLVVSSPDGEVPGFTVWSGLVWQGDAPGAVRADPGQRLERWLLSETMLPVVFTTYSLDFEAVNKPRNEQPIIGLPGDRRIGGLQCPRAPAFPGNVMPWTDATVGNNCYSYANNESATKSTPPIPGKHDSNVTFNQQSLMTGAKQDKLVATVPPDRLPAACPDGEAEAHYLAICLREQTGQARDFHCLRLDADGTWSHKDGKKRVRNTDDTGTPITDLRTARFKDQLTFVGFFGSMEGVRKIFQA
jgi:hypothetical protein